MLGIVLSVLDGVGDTVISDFIKSCFLLIETPLCLWGLCPWWLYGLDRTTECVAVASCCPARFFLPEVSWVVFFSPGLYLSHHAYWQVELPFRICWEDLYSFCSHPFFPALGGEELQTWLLASFKITSTLVCSSTSNNAPKSPASSPTPPVNLWS